MQIFIARALFALAVPAMAAGSAVPAKSSSETVIFPAESNKVRLIGRAQATDAGGYRFGYPGVTLELAVDGGELRMQAKSTSDASYLSIQVDDQPPRALKLASEATSVPIIDDNQPHRVRVSHRSETWHGIVTVESFTLEGGTLLSHPPAPDRRMLVIGDSVTCGEAIERQPGCKKDSSWWNPEASYGKLIARSLNADVHLVCYGGRGLIRSWNGSTEDAQAPEFFEQTIAQPGAPAWDHGDYQPQLILISLGTNDFSLGIGPLPGEELFVSTYTRFVTRILEQHPAARVVLTEGAMVSDQADPTRPQKSVLRRYIAETVTRLDDTRVHQIYSRHYPGDSCDAHPTREQHAAMADDLTPHVREIMGW